MRFGRDFSVRHYFVMTSHDRVCLFSRCRDAAQDILDMYICINIYMYIYIYLYVHIQAVCLISIHIFTLCTHVYIHIHAMYMYGPLVIGITVEIFKSRIKASTLGEMFV